MFVFLPDGSYAVQPEKSVQVHLNASQLTFDPSAQVAVPVAAKAAGGTTINKATATSKQM